MISRQKTIHGVLLHTYLQQKIKTYINDNINQKGMIWQKFVLRARKKNQDFFSHPARLARIRCTKWEDIGFSSSGGGQEMGSGYSCGSRGERKWRRPEKVDYSARRSGLYLFALASSNFYPPVLWTFFLHAWLIIFNWLREGINSVNWFLISTLFFFRSMSN